LIPLFKRFYKRAVKVTIGIGLVVANLDQNGPRISFAINRSNSSTPDTGTISMWNLRPSTRDALRVLKETDSSVRVRLAVGYEGKTKEIFDAETHDLQPGKFAGPDIITRISVVDGGNAYREGYVNETFAPKTPLVDALISIALAMGIGVAPTSFALFQQKITLSILNTTSGPFAIEGKAADSLDVLCAMTGLRWFIRDNQIILQEMRTFLDDFAVILNPRTGLLWNEDPHFFDQIKAKALLNPDLQPGRQFKLQDRALKPIGAPAYAIESIAYRGDTQGG